MGVAVGVGSAGGAGSGIGSQSGAQDFSPTNLSCLVGFFNPMFDAATDAWGNRLSHDAAWADYAQGEAAKEMSIVSAHWDSNKDSLQGDGAADLYEMASEETLMPAYSFFAALETSDLLADMFVTSGTSQDAVIIDTNGRLRLKTTGGLTTVSAASSFSGSTQYRVIVTVASNGNARCWADGTEVTTGGTPNVTDDFRHSILGARLDGTEHHDGHYGPLGFCQADITNEVALLDKWLAAWMGV